MANEELTAYLKRNLSDHPSKKTKKPLEGYVMVTELRDIAADVGRSLGYDFEGYSSAGVTLTKDNKTTEISRIPINESGLCRIVISRK